MVDRATVAQLERLYTERDDLGRAKNELQHNFWVGIVNDSFRGTGTRASVMNAVGGTQTLIDIFHAATVAKIDALQEEITAKIEELGGQP